MEYSPDAAKLKKKLAQQQYEQLMPLVKSNGKYKELIEVESALWVVTHLLNDKTNSINFGEIAHELFEEYKKANKPKAFVKKPKKKSLAVTIDDLTKEVNPKMIFLGDHYLYGYIGAISIPDLDVGKTVEDICGRVTYSTMKEFNLSFLANSIKSDRYWQDFTERLVRNTSDNFCSTVDDAIILLKDTPKLSNLTKLNEFVYHARLDSIEQELAAELTLWLAEVSRNVFELCSKVTRKYGD